MSHSESFSCLFQNPLRGKCLTKEFFGPYFPAFGLNMDIYSENLHIQSKY